jgi:DNA-binding beta-propeller fold protein YncE
MKDLSPHYKPSHSSAIARCVAAVALLLGLGASDALAQRIVDTIALPDYSAMTVAVNPVTNRVYVGRYFDHVTVFDATTHEVIAVIDQPMGPRDASMVVNTRTNKIYTGTLTGIGVIDGATNQSQFFELLAPGEALAGWGPSVHLHGLELEVDEERNRVYVSGLPNPSNPHEVVAIFDGSTNQITGWFPAPSIVEDGVVIFGPILLDMAVDPRTDRVYVIEHVGGSFTPFGGEFMGILVYDGTSRSLVSVLRPYPLANEAFFLWNSNSPPTVVVNSRTGRVYVHDFDALYEIDSVSGELLSMRRGFEQDEFGGWFNRFNAAPTVYRMAPTLVDESRNRLYLSLHIHSFTGLRPYDYASDATLPGGLPYFWQSPLFLTPASAFNSNAGFNPSTGRFYLVDWSGWVYVIDLHSGDVAEGANVTTSVDAATLTFDSVTSPGPVSVTPLADAATAGDVPGGFAVSELSAYEVEAGAGLSFTGPVVVGFKVPFVDENDDGVDDRDGTAFSDLRIHHREQTGTDGSGNPIYALVDRTILAPDAPAPDLGARMVYARVSSFSPFYLTRAGNRIQSLFDQSRAYQAGRTVPIKLRLLDAGGANVSSANVTLTARSILRIGSNTVTAVADSGNANPDAAFRYDADLGGYVYNLSTRGLAPGRYVLSVYAGSDRSFFYTVAFEVR